MEGEIQLTLYRIEAIVKRVKSCIEELDKLQATAKMNLSFDENERLEKAIKKLKEIQWKNISISNI